HSTDGDDLHGGAFQLGWYGEVMQGDDAVFRIEEDALCSLGGEAGELVANLVGAGGGEKAGHRVAV
ncbi:MAG: hypothetical protein JWQ43_1607, partial [Glaciihabitans sp.]|nr:hypothetical protein [Glaciihabitans sp.]